MKKYVIIPIALVILVVITGYCVVFQPHDQATEVTRAFPINHFSANDFYHSIEYASKKSQPTAEHIAGAILPHYLVDANAVADSYATIAKNTNPTTIILIGPDHYDQSKTGIASTSWGFETEMGTLYPHTDLISTLESEGIVEINNPIFENEHSVLSHVAYIKYYFPTATIVPIIVRSGLSQERAIALGERLEQELGPQTLLIASIDFSHYLTDQKASANDEITHTAMNSFDYNTLYTMNSDYFDTRPGMVTFLRAMELHETTKQTILHHSNSGAFFNDPALPTTSYFMMYYSK